MNLRIVYLLVAATLLIPMASAATPQPEDVGVSGECYDADGSGGEAELEVENSVVYNTVLPSDPTNPLGSGALAALVAFVGDPKGIPAGNACTAPGDDHLEAHAFVDGVGGIEVCYTGTIPPGVFNFDACDNDAENDLG
jgi:hypothetical protein